VKLERRDANAKSLLGLWVNTDCLIALPFESLTISG